MLNKGPSKTFQNKGKWIHKPQKTVVFICATCGAKYIKTPLSLEACIKCTSNARHSL